MEQTPDVMSVTALHDRFAGPLFVFALRALGDRGAAEEVVQDTLVNAWRHADRYDPARGAVSTWLFAMARNRVVDRMRRRAVRPEVVVDLTDRALASDDLELDRVLEAWQLAEGLAALSDDHRAAIVEVYYRGRSVAETAAELEIPEGTVKSRVYYGLKALRLRLEEMGVVS